MDQNLKKIIPFALKYKRNAILNIIFNVFYAFFSTILMVSLIPTLDVLFDKTTKVLTKPVYTGIGSINKYGQEYLGYYITKLNDDYGAQYALMLVVGIVIITALLKNIFNYLASFQVTILRNGVLRDLREKLYAKIIHLPISFYSNQRKGDVMTKMLGDVGEVQNSFFQILELVVREPLTIVFSIIAMLAISVKLTLFVFAFIPISGFIISRVGKNLKAKSVRAQQEQGLFISTLDETLTGLKVVKSYNAEGSFIQKFNDSLERLLKLSTSIANKNNLASPMSEFLGIVTIAVLLWFGGHMVLVEHSLKGTDFIGYITLLEQENVVVNKPDAFVKHTFEKGISVKNINFAYQEENVLKNFSFDVEKGKTIALVGQSGSGKSTIANLLTRFYDINDGSITVDGVEVRDWDMHALRGLIGLVTQDSILFNESIKNNMLIGKPNATDEEIIDALKIANAYEFVSTLPNGINTNIGDAGGKLSGGQKQRLSIARAVLKNPPIMILDEATSALDTESEKLVQDALEKMMQNRTSIVIAHRLSTIQKADNIIVMQKGEIVEQGKHAELIAKNGTYARLVALQSLE
jgi:subfamily B ATP-binding cassette protein MsbA